MLAFLSFQLSKFLRGFEKWGLDLSTKTRVPKIKKRKGQNITHENSGALKTRVPKNDSTKNIITKMKVLLPNLFSFLGNMVDIFRLNK